MKCINCGSFYNGTRLDELFNASTLSSLSEKLSIDKSTLLREYCLCSSCLEKMRQSQEDEEKSTKICARCMGTGWISIHEPQCRNCHGAGRLPRSHLKTNSLLIYVGFVMIGCGWLDFQYASTVRILGIVVVAASFLIPKIFNWLEGMAIWG